jgi:predicted ATPase
LIERLKIVNFKAFAEADIPLGSYTLLSGLNSSGKSTVLQALALIRQARDHLHMHDDSGGLPLNGDLVELGTGRDVLHEFYDAQPDTEPQIGFQLSTGSQVAGEWHAEYRREDGFLHLSYCFPDALFTSDEQSSLSIFNPGFQYLRADRLNPANTYPRSRELSTHRGSLGTRGEYAVDYLHQHQDELVSPVLWHDPDGLPRLLDQVCAWLGEICPGVRVQSASIELTDLVRIGFQFTQTGQLTSEPRRPTNVGFGLSYVLPIIVACLTAKPGSLLLLENPEAHVHPQGQSAMARLTCAAAAAGAQVIVETHSDHILNGVRIAVKRQLLQAEDVVLLYFERGDDGIHIVSPAIGPDGMLSQWPQGFFDEWDRSLDQLLG